MTSISQWRFKTTNSVGVSGIKIVAVPSKESDVAGLYKVIWNDLLSFVSSYRHKLDTDVLRKAALSNFTPNDILEGKLLLVSEFEVFLLGEIGQFKAKIRNTQERQAHEAELTSLMIFWDYLMLLSPSV